MDINRLIHPVPLYCVPKRVPGGPGDYYKLEQNGLARMWKGPFTFYLSDRHNVNAPPLRPPSMYKAIFGTMRDFREIEKTMLPHKVDDPIQRNSNGNRIKLAIKVRRPRYVVGLGNSITEQSGCGAY